MDVFADVAVWSGAELTSLSPGKQSCLTRHPSVACELYAEDIWESS